MGASDAEADGDFGHVSDDILAEIFFHLPLECLPVAAGVCKRWRKHALAGAVLIQLPKSKLLRNPLSLSIAAPGISQKLSSADGEEEGGLSEAALVPGHGVLVVARMKRMATLSADDGTDHELSLSEADRDTLEKQSRPRGCCRNSAMWSSSTMATSATETGTTSLNMSHRSHAVLAEELASNQWCVRESRLGNVLLGDNVTSLDASHARQLAVLSITGCGKLERLVVPSGLQILEAHGCGSLDTLSIGRSGLGEDPVGLPQMMSLNVNGCRQLAGKTIARVFPLSGNLDSCRYLNLSWCLRASDDVLASLMKRCPNVEELFLRGIAGNATLRELASGACPSLRSIDLAFSLNVRDESVSAMASRCTRLQWCNLRGCKRISGPFFNSITRTMHARRAAAGSVSPEDFHYLKRDHSLPEYTEGVLLP